MAASFQVATLAQGIAPGVGIGHAGRLDEPSPCGSLGVEEPAHEGPVIEVAGELDRLGPRGDPAAGIRRCDGDHIKPGLAEGGRVLRVGPPSIVVLTTAAANFLEADEEFAVGPGPA